jgi:hypothetical protein
MLAEFAPKDKNRVQGNQQPYLETTIPSYLTSWRSRDLVIAGPPALPPLPTSPAKMVL